MASSSSPPRNHDVFLSFRGVDTRRTFANLLYSALSRNGVSVFRDDVNRQESGESIAPELMRAIAESRVSVIVFSKNYASSSSSSSSSWCLDEPWKSCQIRNRRGQIVSQQRPQTWSCLKDIENYGTANFNNSRTLNLGGFPSPARALPHTYYLNTISIGLLHFNHQKNKKKDSLPASTSTTGTTCKILTASLTSGYDPNIINLAHEYDMKSRCFISPDSRRVVPNGGDIDVEIEKLLRGAGALRATDIPSHHGFTTNHDSDRDAAVYHWREGWNKPSHNLIPRYDLRYILLFLMAALVAGITYKAAFRLPGGTLKRAYKYNYAANGTLQLKTRALDAMVTQLFILFNSAGFVASVFVIIFLLHEFPLKPWPQISVCALFGSYVCLIMATSPLEALALLFLAIPFLLLAAAAKLDGFCKSMLLFKFSYIL